jgi:hypothetical protein
MKRMACNNSRWKAANQSTYWKIRRRQTELIHKYRYMSLLMHCSVFYVALHPSNIHTSQTPESESLLSKKTLVFLAQDPWCVTTLLCCEL